MKDLRVFSALKKLLTRYARGVLEAHETVIGSKTKGNKPAYHLYGKKVVRIAGRKPQQTYFAGIILQKNFVGFYSMPVYSHRKLLPISNPSLKKFLKGKSCFNVTHLDAAILGELDAHLENGLEIYKKEGWV